MITRVPQELQEGLRRRSTDPQYGSLLKLHASVIEQFLEAKPYKQPDFTWSMPAKRGTPGWMSTYNVVVPVELQELVKGEASTLDVSLTILLYSALAWWNARS